MPKRTDIKKILIIGSGPIVIGQACEFDYSGTQAAQALKEEGYEVVLVNSNPATIMTDPEYADATYIEPLNWQTVAKIIEKEKPQALLPTMGGQTALNTSLSLAKHGILEKYNVEMIGAEKEVIDKAEDRQKFRDAMDKIGLKSPESYVCKELKSALDSVKSLGFPCIIRPSYTLGGEGGGIAYNIEEFKEICTRGFTLSPTHEILIDRSLIGWKEYEMEVVRDINDNCIIICSIENFDAMGVHTGDSITIAPAQTLTDKEYQLMRDASIKVLREIGVKTGGSNVQFAINPENGEMIVIEMNPRVSRSSALASKVTGFPIAKIAAKLAIGYTLDELKNDITQGATPASFEPTIDYVATKIPKFAFEKFQGSDSTLTTQMKSVGEVMAIAPTFKQSLQKAITSMENDKSGFDSNFNEFSDEEFDYENIRSEIKSHLKRPNENRLYYIADAFRFDISLENIYRYTKIDLWFLHQIQEIIESEKLLKNQKLTSIDYNKILSLKKDGFSDARIAKLTNVSEMEVREYRESLQILPSFRKIDSCAAEFKAETDYFYSCYEQYSEAYCSDRKKIMIIGSGPNRIGQGVEFDYCCIHAVFAAKEAGYEAIMVNSNPETVSTDYDISDKLYFEPITVESILNIAQIEQPTGIIVQFGGQTPLKIAKQIEEAGFKIIGTSTDAIDRAENRDRFKNMLDLLSIKQPENDTATKLEEAIEISKRLNFPLVLRPSYVLGGRAMEIVYSEKELKSYIDRAVKVSNKSPVLIEKFLYDAIEVDVDAICDGKEVVICGILEHIEYAGIHSGDSACSFPPYNLSQNIQNKIKKITIDVAKELKVIGLMNIQFAILEDEIYIIEVNPRASRTVPFLSKASGKSLAKIAAKCMMGISLEEQKFVYNDQFDFFTVKEAVFPFEKFLGVDPTLGPEMRSTGEVMGIGKTFSEAFAKAITAGGEVIPTPTPSCNYVFISVRKKDQKHIGELAKILIHNGFKIVATDGTARAIQQNNIEVETIYKVGEGRPNILDRIKNNEVSLIINTYEGNRQSILDSQHIRLAALQNNIFFTTTYTSAEVLVNSLEYSNNLLSNVNSLQALHNE